MSHRAEGFEATAAMNAFRLLGLFAGQPRPLPHDGRPSAIFKQPVVTPQRLDPAGLQADAQGDRRLHGGPDRALCHYPSEHYCFWAAQYPARAEAFAPGAFGENLSTRGLTEQAIAVGDVFRLGTATIQVSQPRTPCWKLGHRFELDELPRAVAETGRSGWLYRVLEGGRVEPGATLERLARDPAGVTLSQLWALHNDPRPSIADLEHVAALAVLAQPWRKRFSARLNWLRTHAADR